MIGVTIPKWAYYVVGGAAFLGVFAISELGWDFLTSPLMFLVGLAMASYGIINQVNRWTAKGFGEEPPVEVERKVVFMEIAATAQDVSLILIGILLAAGAFIRLLDIWEPIQAYLRTHPGWLIGAVGLGFLLASLQGLFGEQPPVSTPMAFLSLLPRRIISVVGIVVALGLLLVGVTALVWPAGFEAFFQSLWQLLPQTPDYGPLMTPVSG